MGVSFSPAASPTALKSIRGPSVVGRCTCVVTGPWMIWRGCSTRAFAAGSTIMDGSVLRPSILPCGTSSDTWRDGPPESTSPYADTSGVPDNGLRASLNVSLGCLPIGPCSMDTAEQWEPDDARVSRPVLRERGDETPRATRLIVRIAGKQMYLWRAVDHEGEVLEMLVSVVATGRRR